MSDSTKTLIGAIAALLTVIACTSIMAQCSVATESLDVRIADCVKAGGHWDRNMGDGICEPQPRPR